MSEIRISELSLEELIAHNKRNFEEALRGRVANLFSLYLPIYERKGITAFIDKCVTGMSAKPTPEAIWHMEAPYMLEFVKTSATITEADKVYFAMWIGR